MTIPTGNIAKAILTPNARVPFVTPKDGLLTFSHGMPLLQQIVSLINGLSPTVASNASTASSTNVITLTPVTTAPQVSGYFAYWGFSFVADFTSTGTVTATVVPSTGTLSTLPVYKNNGSTAAGAGDIVAGSFYVLYFVDSLNAGAGGWVIK